MLKLGGKRPFELAGEMELGMKKRILSVFGTRPEAIKMAPLVRQLAQVEQFESVVCLSGQHSSMLRQVMDFFELSAEFNLQVMDSRPTLTEVYSRVLTRMQPVLEEVQPDLVLVHGDTATTAAATMAAFFHQIPVGHVEAGLRTGNMKSPWPEEFNRRLAGMTADIHFAPTETSKRNLLSEKVAEKNIHVVGNTVIDALFEALKRLTADTTFLHEFYQKYPMFTSDKKIVLVTGHRRENFGDGLKNVCLAIRELSKRENTEIVFPVHLNPKVKGPVMELLGGVEGVHLIPPADYQEFVYLMKRSDLVITDSGGIQEEAPSFGKPVLVTRDTTERPEAVEVGTVELVGTDFELILSKAKSWLDAPSVSEEAMRKKNPYGDGRSCERVVQILAEKLMPGLILPERAPFEISHLLNG